MRVKYRDCITVCETKENFVSQYVKQPENEKFVLAGVSCLMA